MEHRKITIKGLVQGVGFRPSVYRLALEYDIKGSVENNNMGVIIYAEAPAAVLDRFEEALVTRTPVAACINEKNSEHLPIVEYEEFSIVKSTSISDEVTEVSPDIAVCADCLNDLDNQAHRISYPLINCTNCGPRFTIIQQLPYDRKLTTMAPFSMCPQCNSEYTNILDRRFHAQPVACNNCGPTYIMTLRKQTINNIQEILETASKLIDADAIVALKGMGGYNLACNALSSNATDRLRRLKRREGKPFALMAGSLEAAQKYAYISSSEADLLRGWRAPIVLLKHKGNINNSICRGLDTIGIMLPYMPFHHLLFKYLNTDLIVLTSGNFSDEPIIIDDSSATEVFSDYVDAFITYNRAIHNRNDDSVALIVNNTPRLIRRSRGWVPSPIRLDLNTEGILATGAELVNCFAIGKGDQAILSQHIGDLKNMETMDFYRESIRRFSSLFRFAPTIVATDLHPDYLSTRYGHEQGVQVLGIQHHHAHMASVMAEHKLNQKVIGICLDGTGYGTDGHIWGGEFLYGDFMDFERPFHFEYVPQPGGDAVSSHPWRMGVACLFHLLGEETARDVYQNKSDIKQDELDVILSMLRNNINSPKTSSTGRMFDAVASLIGVCQNSSYHAEAPMLLESLARNITTGHYHWNRNEGRISMAPMFSQILDDIKSGEESAIIAARFHNTIIECAKDTVESIKMLTGCNTVVLSGGSFQNRILLEGIEQRLKECNFAVYSNSQVPANDAGIALGQMAIAARRRSNGI